jgi:hypothetical protein
LKAWLLDLRLDADGAINLAKLAFARYFERKIPAAGFRFLTEPKRSHGFVSLAIERIGQMKLVVLLAASAVALSSSLALAGDAGAPSGPGATTGDPAASSGTAGIAPTTGNSMKSNPSGSGTSTSGGKDDNGDQGRDKMPESNNAVRPDNQPNRR